MSDNGKDIRRALKAAAQTPKKPNPYKDDVDYISMMGYRDDSPFNNRPYIDINTPNGMIDMSATGIPLYANGRYLPPYSGMHQFEPGIVREQRIPTAQYGNAGMRGMMKARMAYANEFGNPSAKRMVSPSPSDYTFTGNEFDAWKGKPTGVLAGESGTHYMGAFDNYAVPFIQENQGKLGFKSRPDTRDAEAMRFENPEEALYFSENYKDIAPMMRNWEKKEGGWLDELDHGGPHNDPTLPEVEITADTPERIKKQSNIILGTKPKKNYAITDKKNNRTYYYKPNGELIKSEPVITGKSNNDVDRGLSMKEWFEQTGSDSHEDYFKYLSDNKFQTTPSGIYNISGVRENTSKDPSLLGRIINKFRPEKAKKILENRLRDYGIQEKLLTLKSEFGVGSSKAIHGTNNPNRMAALQVPGADKNLSNGCINVNGKTICFDTLEKGSSYYILPEENEELLEPDTYGKLGKGENVKGILKTKKKIEESLKKSNIPFEPGALDFLTAVAEKETKGGRSLNAKLQDLLPHALAHSQGTFQINPESFKEYLPEKYTESFDDQVKAVNNFYNANYKTPKGGYTDPAEMYKKYSGDTKGKYSDKFNNLYTAAMAGYKTGGQPPIGWLDQEEFRRGGSSMTNPLMKFRSKRTGTSKNIQSSINKMFLRNYDLFGPGGKNIYNPKSKYEEGGQIGWLDDLPPYQNAGTTGVKQPYIASPNELTRAALPKAQQEMLKQEMMMKVNPKVEAQLSQTRNFGEEEQGYSNKVTRRIESPFSDVGSAAGNIASYLTRLKGMTPEEVAATTNNPTGALKFAAEIGSQALLNEMIGAGASKLFNKGLQKLYGLDKYPHLPDLGLKPLPALPNGAHDESVFKSIKDAGLEQQMAQAQEAEAEAIHKKAFPLLEYQQPTVQPFVRKASGPWSKQELPGLHIKSTMEGSPFEKQLSKSGAISINNIKAHIGKPDVGQQDKFILNKVLDEKFAGKTNIDYNDFRKAVSEELVPLERNTLIDSNTNWGVGRLGYPSARKQSWDNALLNIKDQIENLEITLSQPIEPTSWETADQIKQALKTRLADLKKKQADNLVEYEKLPLENNSITYSNSSKFGKGSADHFDESTLGHARTLVSRDEPEVMHIIEQQSDYYQKAAKQEKIIDNMIHPIHKEKRLQSLNNLEKTAQYDIAVAKEYRRRMENGLPDNDGHMIHESQVRQMEDIATARLKSVQMSRGDLSNPVQKDLLGKAHQERLLQENIGYAAEQGKSKVRYPTSETAIKIQGYTQKDYDIVFKELEDLRAGKISDVTKLSRETKAVITGQGNTGLVDITGEIPITRNYKDVLSDLDKNKDFARFLENKKGAKGYDPEHQTILKKYDEMPKMIKKTTGKNVYEVIDPNGNTWYEFDIPEKFKVGKGEIKAFRTGGQQKGWLDDLH